MYIQIVRDLGVLEEESGKQKYYIGTGLNLIQLKQHEYDVWRSIKKMQSIETWRNSMRERIRSTTTERIEDIEQKLLNLKTIHTLSIDCVDIDLLKKLRVIRNGCAIGQRDGFWIMGTADQKRMFELGTKDEYQIWTEASSYRSLYTIMLSVSKKKNISVDEALILINKVTKNFVRSGIWTIEYVEGGAILNE